MSYRNTEIIMYQSEDGQTKIDVRMEDETVWLSQAQMAELFQTTKQNVSLHIRNTFDEGELRSSATVKEYLTVQNEGVREVRRNIKYYNLDVIISVGYRVKSLRGTQFRIWATERLKEYIVKGFTMNDDLLKKAGGGNYWRELLERIRDIRSSEKIFYRQLLDLFATSVDYDPKSEECKRFFQIVQNKMHYAVNKQTAAEIISNRANAVLPFMGIKTFSGDQPQKEDALIAKNYLDDKELAMLNRMVSAFFDLAELHALNHEHMYMRIGSHRWMILQSVMGKVYCRTRVQSVGRRRLKKQLRSIRNTASGLLTSPPVPNVIIWKALNRHKKGWKVKKNDRFNPLFPCPVR